METPHHSIKHVFCWECVWIVCTMLSMVISLSVQDWAYHAARMNEERLAWGVIGSSAFIIISTVALLQCRISNELKVIQMVAMVPAISIIIGIVVIWFM